jgi:SAM-dependent methyltransferase
MSATEWPGEDRRSPRTTSATWVVRSALSEWLRAEADEARARGSYRVLDVGCGPKPYYPFFADAAEYVGVDVVENPAAELRGSVEDLPVEDGAFDLVLCTQVLEHCDDPAQAVRELRRVVAPGGRVLASTHGVQVYHPSPGDYWRWTHEGLRRLFEQNAEWASLTVTPAAGTASTLAMLLGTYVEIALRRTPLARGPVWALNAGGAALDRRVTSLREPVPGSLTANLHVVADAAGTQVPASTSS